jgi:hypothetical protein
LVFAEVQHHSFTVLLVQLQGEQTHNISTSHYSSSSPIKHSTTQGLLGKDSASFRGLNEFITSLVDNQRPSVDDNFKLALAADKDRETVYGYLQTYPTLAPVLFVWYSLTPRASDLVKELEVAKKGSGSKPTPGNASLPSGGSRSAFSGLPLLSSLLNAPAPTASGDFEKKRAASCKALNVLRESALFNFAFKSSTGNVMMKKDVPNPSTVGNQGATVMVSHCCSPP